MSDLLAVIGSDTRLKRVAQTHGGEHAGPCPWCGGNDRFRVWPNEGDHGRYWCRRCGKSGDGIDYLREHDGLTFQQACERLGATGKLSLPPARPQTRGNGPRRRDSGGSGRSPLPSNQSTSRAISPSDPLEPPNEAWQNMGRQLVADSVSALWSETGVEALNWLRERGLFDETIKAARLGYQPQDKYDDRAKWGLEAGKRIWTPRGVVIPWFIDGALWKINIRRPAGEPKYIGPAGWSKGLYGVDRLWSDRPAVLVEGEFDALILDQHAGDLVTPVATGGTEGARRSRWVGVLALCPAVLVAFDVDANNAGDKAARYWCKVLSRAIRWRPSWGDVSDMAQSGADIKAWIAAGAEHAQTTGGEE